MTIGLQFAMRIEAQPFLEFFKPRILPSPKERFPFQFYWTEYRNSQIIIALAGVDTHHDVDLMGTVPATLLTDALIESFRPSLVISAGTAGGFLAQQAQMGEVFLGQEYVAFHSRRFPIPDKPHWDKWARGFYPVKDVRALAEKLGLRTGIVSSGDALDCSQEDAEYLRKNRATLKEMEAAAIGWVCAQHGVEFLPIKAVTDFVDSPEATHAQFFVNYQNAIAGLFTQTLRVLDEFTV